MGTTRVSQLRATTMRCVVLLPMLLPLLLPMKAAADETGATTGANAENSANSAETARRYGKPEHLCELESPQITESSGLAVSRVRPDVFWTHNDSGDKPRLYSFSIGGEHLGVHTIANAQSRDWEDMASIVLDGIPYLVIGDVGDNQQGRDDCALYFVREPMQPGETLPVERVIRFRYADTPRDCESLAIDTSSGSVLLATKNWTATAQVYSFPLPEAGEKQVAVAEPIAKVPVAGATAMDVSADGRQLVLGTYANAFAWQRGPQESWSEALTRPPDEITMPPRKQGESICYGVDGKTIFLTSERRPTPLFRVSTD